MWCDKCQGLLQFLAINTPRNILNEISNQFQKVDNILSAPHNTDSDLDFILKFLRISDASLSESGKELKLRLWINHDCFLETKAKFSRRFKLYPGTDNFFYQFIGIYIQKKTFRGSLIVFLLKAYIAKIKTAINTSVYLKVYNFFLPLIPRQESPSIMCLQIYMTSHYRKSRNVNLIWSKTILHLLTMTETW